MVLCRAFRFGLGLCVYLCVWICVVVCCLCLSVGVGCFALGILGCLLAC